MKLKNCKAEDFPAQLNGRKVICFGAGSTLIEADYEIKKIEYLEKHIAFFVDNDQSKHGLKFKYCGHEFDIKSVDSLKDVDSMKYVLLITCAFYIEIYNQLKNIPEIKDLECYMYNVVCSYPSLDVEKFFCQEIEKLPFREWKKVLENLHLKNKHKGQRCFVIGNGPSLSIADLELLKGEITFAANRIFKLFDKTDWKPTYFFCIDYLMYGADHKEINKVDADLRFVPIERALAAGEVYDEITYYNRVVDCVEIRDGNIVRGKQFRFSDNVEEIVYGGQTVLYDALQVAAYMGFAEIYLLGVDCDFKLEVLEDGTIVENNLEKNHFDESYEEGLDTVVAEVSPLYAIRLAFQKAKEYCESNGIIIRNATRGGKLDIFDRIALEDILD